MTDLSLEQFLAREADAGQAQESGSFTIEIGSALEKMRRYRFEDPNSHLLYAVRSAVLAGGRDMTISSPAGSFGIRFFVDEPGRYGQIASIVKSLAQVEIEDSLNAQLTLALQGALNLCPHGAEWIHIRGKKRETMWCGPEGIHLQRKFTAHSNPLESEFRFVEKRVGSSRLEKMRRGSFLEKFWFFLTYRQSEDVLSRLSNLRTRLPVVPLRLHFSGTPAERIGGAERKQVLQLARKRVLQRGFWVIKNPAYQIYLDATGQEVKEPKGEFARCFHCLMEGEEKTTLHWVLDGIILESEELNPAGPHFEAWVSADGLSTDLSGLKLIRDEALRARISEIHELAKSRLLGRR